MSEICLQSWKDNISEHCLSHTIYCRIRVCVCVCMVSLCCFCSLSGWVCIQVCRPGKCGSMGAWPGSTRRRWQQGRQCRSKQEGGQARAHLLAPCCCCLVRSAVAVAAAAKQGRGTSGPVGWPGLSRLTWQSPPSHSLLQGCLCSTWRAYSLGAASCSP